MGTGLVKWNIERLFRMRNERRQRVDDCARGKQLLLSSDMGEEHDRKEGGPLRTCGRCRSKTAKLASHPAIDVRLDGDGSIIKTFFISRRRREIGLPLRSP